MNIEKGITQVPMTVKGYWAYGSKVDEGDMIINVDNTKLTVPSKYISDIKELRESQDATKAYDDGVFVEVLVYNKLTHLNSPKTKATLTIVRIKGL